MAARSTVPRQPVRWTGYAGYAGYAACAWALVFAAVSCYWATGGIVGADTIGPALTALTLARDPGFVAIRWATGILKVMAGRLAFAVLRPLGRRILHWLLPLLAGWDTGAVLVVFGGASCAQHALMLAGIIAIPDGLDAMTAWWHLLLWDPWWLLGGILFIVAAWRFGRETSLHKQSQV